MENAILSQEGQWSCPNCGAANYSSEGFCKACGHGNNSAISFVQPQRSNAKKIILIIIIGLFLAGGSSVGAYYYYTYDLKKKSGAYIMTEGKIFADSVGSVNGLSTEKDIAQDESTNDNFDLFFKKIEAEKNVASKALAEINASKEKSDSTKSTKMVAGLDAILVQYYEDISKQLDKYDKYLTYGMALTQEEKTSKAEREKIEELFKNPKSPEEVSKLLKESIRMMNESLNRYKAIPEPAGYEEIKKKDVDATEKLIKLFSDFSEAFDAKNLEKMGQAAGALDEFLANDRLVKDIDELEKYYFDQMHNEFLGIRKKAENIKTEFIKAEISLDVDIPNIDIETW